MQTAATDAEEFLRSGDPTRALSALQSTIRQRPADAQLRVFLAQLLMVLGQWERAVQQLSVVGEMDASALPMVYTYRAAVQCELLRRAVFAGQRSPLVFGEPEGWIARLVQALGSDASGHHAEAAELRAHGFKEAIGTAGQINGQSFEWIADADSRLGPVLEAMIDGGYYWIPFGRIRRIVIEPPENLGDLVWTPAQFTWTNEGQVIGHIPTRYVGSEGADDELRLGRKTEWRPLGGEGFAGLGQRVLATDVDEVALLDVRELVFDAHS